MRAEARSFAGRWCQFINLETEFSKLRERRPQVRLGRYVVNHGIRITWSNVPDREPAQRAYFLTDFSFLASNESAKQLNVVCLWWLDPFGDKDAFGHFFKRLLTMECGTSWQIRRFRQQDLGNAKITVCPIKPFQGNFPLPGISSFRFAHRPLRRVSLRSRAVSR